MKFDDIDRQMRLYEQSLDQVILPELYIAARIDGRNFTRLTKEICQFEAPYDTRFRDMMVNTVKALMEMQDAAMVAKQRGVELTKVFNG